MALILSIHAAEGLKVRNLQLDWIEHTIRAPERTGPDPRQPDLTRSYRVIPEAGGRVLRVVHRLHGDDILVVTAFFDRGARR
ncbi:MAG TPA: DUF4258 domain-containing protein [Acetobacteraceae bacterium]|nr:DUF4258 domain-containing protein [Acetobacteraceae bacterium]